MNGNNQTQCAIYMAMNAPHIIQAAFFSDRNAASEVELMASRGHHSILDRVYPENRRERIAQHCEVYPEIINLANFEACLPDLEKLEAIFTTWGMPILTREQIAQLPNLKILLYAAGSVQHFARPFLESGVQVISAWSANSVPVAEFTQAQIILANKGYFRNIREYQSPAALKTAFRGTGNFDTTVALLGAGMIGRQVIERLKSFNLSIIVFDPFLSVEQANELGVEKVELHEAFERGMTVTNHLANNAETKGLLNRALFEAMPPNAVFINTGRGATVNTPDLIDVFERRPDLIALLDVTQPEPPVEGSPLFSLPNILLSNHMAGSINEEIPRMADLVIEEFLLWQAGQPLRHAVTLEMLETMA